MLAGPTAWMTGLAADYALVRAACSGCSMLLLHFVTIVTLVLAVAGGLVAWREWQRAGAQWPGDGGSALSRTRVMAALGLLGSPLFALAIIAQWAAKLFLNPCMGI